MKKNNIIYVWLLALGFFSCQSEFENKINDSTYYAGEADFSSYVAIGNSLTAGYMDGTIYRTGQQNSFPNLLAGQFRIVGGGDFTQPSFEQDVNDLGGLLLGGNPIASTRLIINAAVGGPQNISGVPTIEVSELQQKAYHNMGVPGAKSYHLLASGYGNLAGVATGQANPFFVRHATSSSTTVLADALSMNPTFFTNWIGANDVLTYATSGGTGVDQTGNLDPSTYGAADITDPNVFANVYSNLIEALTANGAKGVVATVPSITAIPFFTTIPYAPLNSADANFAASIPQLQMLYGALNQMYAALNITGRNLVVNTDGYTPLLIKDESLTDVGASLQAAAQASNNPLLQSLAPLLALHFGQVRQATPNDLILLTTRSAIATEADGIPAPLNMYGITFPLEDKMVLTATEIGYINTATVAYNNTIRTVAQNKGLAVADMNAIMNKLVQGLKTADNQIYTANYFTPSKIHTTLFSLDGVHPNAKGYAVIANEIIKVINAHYNAYIPQLDVSKYPTIKILTSN